MNLISRSEYLSIGVLSFFNIVILAYWLTVWLRSYWSHRDVISLLVFLFIFQSFIGELWFITASYFAILGREMSDIVFYGNLTQRVFVVVVLVSVTYLAFKAQNGKDKTNS